MAESLNQKQPTIKQPRRVKRQEDTHASSRSETSHTENRTNQQPNSEKQFPEVPCDNGKS
jgi:hypothetical protein